MIGHEPLVSACLAHEDDDEFAAHKDETSFLSELCEVFQRTASPRGSLCDELINVDSVPTALSRCSLFPLSGSTGK